MNKASLITVAFVVVACASIGGAVAMRPVELAPPTFEDTGEPLFEKFTDPNLAASLEVKSWDTEDARLSSFSVEFKDGVWVIPSHNNYPADGTERMGKAAASFIDVRKDIVRSNDPQDHAKFGVLDPETAESEEGRGQRVTIKDASGTSLVDIIVGEEVPDKPGFRFVRYPDKPRVYAVKITVDISTEFVDWIEKDLLKLDRDSVVEVVSNSVDEAGPSGLDHVEFLARTNPGQDERPLREIASGGELSRVMLAIKSVLSTKKTEPSSGGGGGIDVLVFDEIDANIGGRLGDVIGRKLRELTGSNTSKTKDPSDIRGRGQVLCITHLPQIAAFADRHFHIVKEVVGGKRKTTDTTVRLLEGKARINELAEMLAGSKASQTSRKQAEELLAAAA